MSNFLLILITALNTQINSTDSQITALIFSVAVSYSNSTNVVGDDVGLLILLIAPPHSDRIIYFSKLGKGQPELTMYSS